MSQTDTFRFRRVLALAAAAFLLAARAGADEALPPGSRVAALEVEPKELVFSRPFSSAQLLVTAVLETGERVDGTRLAEIDGAGDVLSTTPGRRIRALKDGEGTLKLRLGGREASVPFKAGGQTADYKVSFLRDVQPVLSRIGCNAGTCHGSLDGKNGFKLSLRGYDPAFDHVSLTDDHKGRRFNRSAPDKSLFLMKISGKVPHVGGVLTQPGEPYYELLRAWVAQGAVFDGGSPRVAAIEVSPTSALLPLPGMRQQVAVRAAYTDGTVRDVTGESFLESSNTEAVAVDRDGVAAGVRRGEAAILVRYEGSYAAVPTSVMGDRSGFVWQEVPEYNVIDTLVYRKLKAVKSQPSEVCDDAEFLRRIYLDLTGLPPRAKDVRIFLADGRDSRQKRQEVIERLIGGAEFVEHWTNKWADLLQVNAKFLGPQGAVAFRDWIRHAVASNLPYDQFVFAVLNSSGSTLKDPPTAYYKVLRHADEVMENTTQLFLGIRFNCNKCHDHPFERWTQKNHWELAAFFAQVERKDAPGSPKMPRLSDTQTEIPAYEEVIGDREQGDAHYPNGLIALPVFPYAHAGGVPEKSPRREKLARWLTSRDNPYFAKSLVNRVWSYLLGTGIIEPVDDIRAGNPPSNPELLDHLTKDFIEHGFDVRRLLRLIVSSRVYQHSIKTNRWNEDDALNFSHAIARRLSSETLYDAIHQTTGAVTRFPGRRQGTRAAELPDPSFKAPDGFLEIFGRPPRESACECERSSGMSLGQALTLVNGPTIADAVDDPQNAVADLVRVEKNPSTIVEELYLSILNRYPGDAERGPLVKAFDHRDPAIVDALSPENRAEVEKRLVAFEARQRIVDWVALDPGILRSSGGATLSREADGSVFSGGQRPAKDVYTVATLTELTGITGFMLEVLSDDRLPAKGPGRADNGNLLLNELRIAAASAADPTKVAAVVLQSPTASFAQNEFQIEKAIDGKPETGWAILPQAGRAQRAVFEAKEDAGFEGGSILTWTLDQQLDNHSIGRFRLWATKSPRPVRLMDLPDEVVAVIRTPADKRSAEQKTILFRYWIERDAEMRDRMLLNAAQDLAWALLNNPAFLFNR